MTTTTDWRTLGDLASFARIEIQAGDIEPWAAVLAQLHAAGVLGFEGTAWAVKAYNAYDDFGSAFRLVSRWPGPGEWPLCSMDSADAALWPCGTERRNLRGGLVRKHLDSYVAALGSRSQRDWLAWGIGADDPGEAFDGLMAYLRRSCWGTGRQAAFEWAEFAGKALGAPVRAGHGCLWESSGPRQSLERIYNAGERARSQEQLDGWAAECRADLATAGADLEWWDLETVICDFNVMRKGRYYPGKHLAMITEEIDGLPEPWRSDLAAALLAVIPRPWSDIGPGVAKNLETAYARTGKITTPFGVSEEGIRA